jgi:hypothetical protein
LEGKQEEKQAFFGAVLSTNGDEREQMNKEQGTRKVGSEKRVKIER